MLEPEIAFCDLDGLMEVEEGLITHIVQTVLRDCPAELKFLGARSYKTGEYPGAIPAHFV